MGGLRISEWVGAICAAAAVLILTWLFDGQQVARHHAEERARVLDRLSSQRATLEAELNARLHLVRGLAALVKTGDHIPEDRFNAFARELLQNRRDVRALDLAPGGIIKYVYPYDSNRAALGTNIMAVPRFQAVLRQTIDKNILTVAGPVDLVQGGTGLIGRIPIFMDNSAQRELWGLAIIVLDLPPLLLDAGLLTDDWLTHALRGRDGLGDKGEVFFGNADLFNQDPVVLDVSIPNGTWQIAAIPQGGWSTSWPHRGYLWAGGLLAALLAGVIAHRMLLQTSRLHRAIAKSRASEARFRALFDQSFQMIGLLQPNGLLIDANQAAPEILGCPLDNIDDRFVWDAPNFRRSPTAESVFRQHLDASVQDGLQRFDATLIREDGSELIVDLTLKPHFDELGAIEALLLECRDVTDRVHDKAELHKAVECLAESNTELERFAYVASHDLQEPLRSITGFAQLLERRCRSKLAEDEMEFLDFIVTGAKRMHTLVNDLLAYSRVTSKGNPFTAVPLSLAMDTVQMNLHDSIRTAGAEISISGTLPVVLGDHMQMVQLLQNLVGNAIKFHRPDQSPRVHIYCQPGSAGQSTIVIEDNGIGIPVEYRDHIFTMFKRLHSGETYPGTGIGLAICKRILDRHGGRIWVDESSMGGAAFHLTLQDAPPEATE